MDLRLHSIKVLLILGAFSCIMSGCFELVDPEADNYPTLRCPNNITGLTVGLRDRWGYYYISFEETRCLSKKNLERFDDNDYRDEVMKDVISYVRKDKRWIKDYSGPNLIDCGIRDEVRVYADTVLFGLPAGENLIDHFIVEGNSLLCSYPDYQVLNLVKRGSSLKDLFVPGTVMPDLLNACFFHVSSYPEVVPKEFTLTVEIPIDATDWDEFDWMVRTEKYIPLENQRTLVGSVLVKANR